MPPGHRSVQMAKFIEAIRLRQTSNTSAEDLGVYPDYEVGAGRHSPPCSYRNGGDDHVADAGNRAGAVVFATPESPQGPANPYRVPAPGACRLKPKDSLRMCAVQRASICRQFLPSDGDRVY